MLQCRVQHSLHQLGQSGYYSAQYYQLQVFSTRYMKKRGHNHRGSGESVGFFVTLLRNIQTVRAKRLETMAAKMRRRNCYTASAFHVHVCGP